MQYDKVAKSYKAQSVQTASPGKLVLMLFDGCLRFTLAAKRAFDEEEFTKKNEDINNNLIRAQNIVTELQSSLDMSVPGDLPGTLYSGCMILSCINYSKRILRKRPNPYLKLRKSSMNYAMHGLKC